MAIKTGHKISDLAAQVQRIRAQGVALTEDLPRAPLRHLEMLCLCSDCIEQDAFEQLIRTPPPQFTTQMLRDYFSAAGAVPDVLSPYQATEGRVVLTHVLAHLGAAVVQPRHQERAFSRTAYFIYPEYRLTDLLDAGLLETLPDATRTEIRAFLVDVVRYAAATGSALFSYTITYLCLMTDALAQVLEGLRTGPPRQHLRFWTTFTRGFVFKEPKARGANGVDLFSLYDLVPEQCIETMLSALEHPETERLFERYAYAAQDDEWLSYMSNLLQWREVTVTMTRFSERTRR